MVFFFKQKTAYEMRISYWSSDVCSSDLVDVPVLGIIENMSYFVCPHCQGRSDIFSHGGARREAEKLGMEFLGEVPLDMAIRETSDGGRPIVMSQPDSEHAKTYMAIATRVWEKVQATIGGGARTAPRIVIQ